MLVAHIMLLWVTEMKTYKISPQNFNICLRLPDITTHLHTRSLKAVRAIEYCVKKSVSSIYLPDAIVHDESPRPFLLIFAYCNQSRQRGSFVPIPSYLVRYGNKTRGYTLHSHWAVNPLHNPFDYCSMPVGQATATAPIPPSLANLVHNILIKRGYASVQLCSGWSRCHGNEEWVPGVVGCLRGARLCHLWRTLGRRWLLEDL